MENNKPAAFGQLKRKALDSLKGNWLMAILVSLVNTILLSVPGMIKSVHEIRNPIDKLDSMYGFEGLNGLQGFQNHANVSVSAPYGYLSWILNLLIAGALTYGVARFYLNLTRKDSPRIEDILDGFKHFSSTFLINLLLGIFSFLWSLLWVVALVIVVVICVTAAVVGTGKMGAASIVFMVIFILAVVVSLEVFLSRYAMTYYIYNDDNELGVMDAISKSKEMMKGKKVRLFLLRLSFIGWYILGILSLFIGFLWITPYVQATEACFYEDLIKEDLTDESKLPEVQY